MEYPAPSTRGHYFISYNQADRAWAEWIGWMLEAEGHTVVVQAWDFRPGQDFVFEMQRATQESRCTIAVLSDAYLKASFTQSEWAAAFAQDPQGRERKLVPVRVGPCQPEGMLGQRIYIDLVGLDQEVAHARLLDALRERGKPERPPAFPGASTATPAAGATAQAAASTPPSAVARLAPETANLDAMIRRGLDETDPRPWIDAAAALLGRAVQG
ncbi:toll/interleukin-1 receptor domain-containing protein [Haliangium sp.]|uniref:toll/interleukin-1 receptor domain-containing protein n=1 Tax=Haliangium sp. TaxID=2663208 RepID=UPI003D1488DC